MNWIKVNDKLPDLDTPVFCIDEKGFVWIGCRSEAPGEGVFWCNTYGVVWVEDGKYMCSPFLDDDYKPIMWHLFPEIPEIKKEDV
jgi:hypothetical protein